MSHYKSNLRDIEFNLFEASDLPDQLHAGNFGDFDEDAVRDILLEVDRTARGDWAASFVEIDRNPPQLVDGEVKLPAGLKRSLDAYFEAGWDKVALRKELGGSWGPGQLRWAVSEMLYGGNASAMFYLTGVLTAGLLWQIGMPEQVETWARRMIDRRWGSTMVLTEPDAGSDVGASTTKAIAVDEERGIYHIEGVKRFITAGEHD